MLPCTRPPIQNIFEIKFLTVSEMQYLQCDKIRFLDSKISKDLFIKIEIQN